MKKLPVFVFPVSLQFYLASRHTHKQLLTLYNPYDFAVNFQVLCTAPHKFTVTDPEGVIAPQMCVDVAVRYNQPSSTHCNSIDKFRISMQDRTTNQILGKRDVPAKFLPGEPESVISEDRGESFQPMPTRLTGSTSKQTDHGVCSHPSPRGGTPSALVVVVCSLCVIALLMPTAPIDPPPSSSLSNMLPFHWQQRLQLSLHLQLVCAFVLGLLTMVLLRL